MKASRKMKKMKKRRYSKKPDKKRVIKTVRGVTIKRISRAKRVNKTRKFYYQSGGAMSEGMKKIITSVNEVILEPLRTKSIEGKRDTLKIEITHILQSKRRDILLNYEVVIGVFMESLSNIMNHIAKTPDAIRELEKLIELIKQNEYPIRLLEEKVKAGLKLTDESTLNEEEKVENANLHEISDEADQALDAELRNKVFIFSEKCMQFALAPFRGATLVQNAKKAVTENKKFINEIITAKDGKNYTLLTYLVKQKYLEFNLIKTIVENGGDINAIDPQGRNFLVNAIDLIYKSGISPELADYYQDIIIKCIDELGADIFKETEYYKMNAKNYISFLTLTGIIKNGVNERGDIFSNIFYIKEQSIWKDPTFDLASYIIKFVDSYLSLVSQVQILKVTDPGNGERRKDLVNVIQIKLADIKMCVFNNPTIVTKICSNSNARYNNKHLLTFIVSTFDYNLISPLILAINEKYFLAYINNYVESHSRFMESKSIAVNVEDLKEQGRKSALLAFNVPDGKGQTVLSIIDKREPNNKKKLFYMECGFYSPIELAQKILADTEIAEEKKKKFKEMIDEYQSINSEEVGTLLRRQEEEEIAAEKDSKEFESR